MAGGDRPWQDRAARLAARLRATVKHRVLGPLLYRHPPVGLQPDRLYAWHDALLRTGDVPGAVVEVGCNVGGTAAVSWRLLERVGIPRRYVAVDTFSGFVLDQFDADVELGNDPGNRHMFADNSQALTRAVLDRHGAHGVELLRGDITTLDADALPRVVAAALVDVDLADPVYAALDRLWPRLSPGGIILVDDCPERCDWQARAGYRRFVEERGLPERYTFEMGVVERPRDAA
jgi:hypothetical protein